MFFHTKIHHLIIETWAVQNIKKKALVKNVTVAVKCYY